MCELEAGLPRTKYEVLPRAGGEVRGAVAVSTEVDHANPYRVAERQRMPPMGAFADQSAEAKA